MVYIIHYGELVLKGKNRFSFEQSVLNNIKEKFGNFKFKKEYGRLVIYENEYQSGILENILFSTFGISNFSKATICEMNIESIMDTAIKVLGIVDFSSFVVRTRRSNKSFEYNSVKTSQVIGIHVAKTLGKQINLDNPDIVLNVEIGTNMVLVYVDKFKGIGGLPLGCSGKVVSLLSGGIDSPVSSYMMMKRGCESIFFHAYNKTIHSKEVLEKNKKLIQRLTYYQGKSKAYFVDYRDIQSEIVEKIPSDYRMLLFKRSILRVGNLIAKRNKAKALVTGDCMGQVASQTLDNIRVIYSASKLPILSPLIGFDKKDIVDMASSIGTYDISVLPYDDCCSLIAGKSPSTRGKYEMILEFENKIDFFTLEYSAFKESLILDFDFQ